MSSHSGKTLIFSAFIFMLLITTACSKSSVTPSPVTAVSSSSTPAIAGIIPSATPQALNQPTPTQTLTPTNSVLLTDTPMAPSMTPTGSVVSLDTPTPDLSGAQIPTAVATPSIQTLPGGDYVLYLAKRSTSAENSVSLIAFSPTSKLSVVLADNISDKVVGTSRLSGDKTRLAYLPDNKTLTILDLNSHTSTQLALPKISCDSLSWSPAGDQLLLGCGDIYLYTLANQKLQALTTSTKPGEWTAPAWSPDGKWIAYIHPADSMPPIKPTATPTVSYKTQTPQPTPEPVVVKDPKDGLYLVNAICLINIASCPSFTNFVQAWLYAPGAPVWSPDSLSVAVYNTGTITIYNSVGEFKQDIDLPELDTKGDWAYQPMSWSPNGEWLAISGGKRDPNSALRMISIHALTVFEMITNDQSIDLLDWFALPTLKIGQSYLVSMAGDTVRMHETPSADGTLVRRLKHNDVFSVIGGPVYAEGYIWWKIQEKIERTQGWIVENPDWFVNSK